jgi:hypothetical protein
MKFNSLEDFKSYVISQREASKAEALSVLTATIPATTERKEN